MKVIIKQFEGKTIEEDINATWTINDVQNHFCLTGLYSNHTFVSSKKGFMCVRYLVIDGKVVWHVPLHEAKITDWHNTYGFDFIELNQVGGIGATHFSFISAFLTFIDFLGRILTIMEVYKYSRKEICGIVNEVFVLDRDYVSPYDLELFIQKQSSWDLDEFSSTIQLDDKTLCDVLLRYYGFFHIDNKYVYSQAYYDSHKIDFSTLHSDCDGYFNFTLDKGYEQIEYSYPFKLSDTVNDMIEYCLLSENDISYFDFIKEYETGFYINFAQIDNQMKYMIPLSECLLVDVINTHNLKDGNCFRQIKYYNTYYDFDDIFTAFNDIWNNRVQIVMNQGLLYLTGIVKELKNWKTQFISNENVQFQDVIKSMRCRNCWDSETFIGVFNVPENIDISIILYYLGYVYDRYRRAYYMSESLYEKNHDEMKIIIEQYLKG